MAVLIQWVLTPLAGVRDFHNQILPYLSNLLPTTFPNTLAIPISTAGLYKFPCV